MLWTEPWLTLAASREGTRIPPPRPVLPSEDWRFLLSAASEAITAEWLTFVGSGLPVIAAHQRAGEGALVARLYVGGQGATCLLKPVRSETDVPVWLLETFVARPRGRRLGEWLLRCVMWELWVSGRGSGRGSSSGATLVFQWELAGLPALMGAWWRGWLGAALCVERGWRWRRAAEAEACGFCPVTAAWIPTTGVSDGRPQLVRDVSAGWSVVVADSGHCDGWGHVLTIYRGGDVTIDWNRVAAVGEWRELWWRGVSPPDQDWVWTGEWVVVGRVGVAQPVQTRWISADI